jgi:LuxR family maltose regulon positive regulatory protein
MIELLRTKLFIPRPRKNLVSRPRLVDRLNAGLDRKLTLIAAPAGFGKTTLLSEWIPQSPRCVTWLSLEESDNDPARFWAYFIASLQNLSSQLGENALALLQSTQSPPLTSTLALLINDILAFQDPFAIVLDDYHLIDAQQIHESLTFLMDHLPANMHVVMTNRVDPPLPVARMRARATLTEIRANDLRFTIDEITMFLNRVMGLSLTTEEVVALEARTEGWIAGLQIAALSMQGHEDIPGFIKTFSGSHRHILGYLAEEVLNRQPKGTLDFLLQTSILDRLCGPLCDAVTGESGGQEILENLEHANLFLTPLDDERKWYRYHHLFAEVLQARLQQTQHDVLTKLHRRAGNWFANQGRNQEAVRHLLAGADFEVASLLIESVAGGMLRRGASASLMRWLNALPEEIILSRPRLCLARGWTFLWGPSPHVESVDQWARLALQLTVADKSSDVEVKGEAAALLATTASIRWDVARSRELATQALEYLHRDSPWRSVMALCLGTAHFYSGDFVAATRVLEDALRLSQADDANYIQLLTASFLAEIQVIQGHLSRAMEIYQQVLSWSKHGIPQRGTIMAHSGLANILCELNQVEDALSHLQLGIEQLQQVGGAWVAFELYRALARVNVSQGDLANAITALNQASESGKNARVDFVATQVAALRARVQLAQGNLMDAESWAVNNGLSPHDLEVSRPGLREIEYLSYARVLSAQGKHAQASSLLEGLLNAAKDEGRNTSAIAILAVQAVTNQALGNRTLALERLEHALTLARPEGFIRTFIDEGEPMRLLLQDYQAIIKKKIDDSVDGESHRLLAYIENLLATFPQPASPKKLKFNNIPEPLSERELEILRLIAAGKTNQEIAEKLIIAVSTVKTHINNLYGKLGTNRRTEAIMIAREKGLLSE